MLHIRCQMLQILQPSLIIVKYYNKEALENRLKSSKRIFGFKYAKSHVFVSRC